MSGINFSEGKRPNRNFKLDRGGTLGFSGPFKAEVMSTVDPARMGRLRVWIKSFGDESMKHDESSWFTVSYLSPFYGVTKHKFLDQAPDDSNFENNGHAYGMWMNAPDPGAEVLVVFAEADPNQGYYIGFIPEPQMNHMVPGIGSQENPSFSNTAQEEKCAHAPRLPVCEIDKKEESMNHREFTSIEKPIHSVLAGQMWKQGLIADIIRGPISSSSQRESPSYVFGMNTPGRPIYQSGMFDHEARENIKSNNPSDTEVVARRGGHSFVMDDGSIDGENNIIRIRSSSGHQITMSDDGECLYITHANGNSWVELGKEGTIDIFTANSFNVRTKGDVNFHADRNINFSAEENINMYAKKNVLVQADEKTQLIGKKDLTVYSKKLVGVKSDGSLHVQSGSAASWKAGGHTEIVGSTIGLNNSPGSAKNVTAPKQHQLVDYPDVVKDTSVGWKLEPGKFKSVVTRAPTHEPWDSHNTGIDDSKGYD